MSASGTLATQVVELVSKGIGQLKSQMDEIKGGIQKVAQTGEKMQATISRAAAVLTAEFVVGAGAINGWIKAGLAGTGIGNILNFQFQQLSRQIAGVFVPAIQGMIDRLRIVTEWFRHLTGAQQEQLRYWIEGAAAMMLVVTTAPMVVAGLATIWASLAAGAAVIAALWSAFTGGFDSIFQAIGAVASAVLKMLMPLITPLIGLLTGLLVGTEKGRSIIGEVISWLKDKLGTLLSFVSGIIDQFQDAFAGIFDVVKEVGEVVLGMLGAIPDPLREFIGIVIRGVAQTLGIVAQLGAALLQLFSPLIQIMSRVLEPIGRLLTTLMRLLEPIGRIIGVVLVAALRVVLALVGPILGVVEKIIDKMADSFEAFVNDLIRGVEKLVDFLNDVAEKLAAAAEKLGLDKIADNLRSFHIGADHKDKKRTDVGGGAAGQESLSATWARIQTAVLQTTFDPRKAAEDAGKQRSETNRLLAEGFAAAVNVGKDARVLRVGA